MLSFKEEINAKRALINKQLALLDQQEIEGLARERELALPRLIAEVNELGITAEHFGWRLEKPNKVSGASQPRPVKYYDPVTDSKWSGCGNPPGWIRGKDRNLFLIANQVPNSMINPIADPLPNSPAASGDSMSNSEDNQAVSPDANPVSDADANRIADSNLPSVIELIVKSAIEPMTSSDVESVDIVVSSSPANSTIEPNAAVVGEPA